jgi:hypothetical protein
MINERVPTYDPAKCKPFDLEKALAGAPVCTASGDPVTQLTLFKGEHLKYPLVGIIDGGMGTWMADGKRLGESAPNMDLRMAPRTVELWVWVWPSKSSVGTVLFSTEDRCKQTYSQNKGHPAKVTWEE